MHVYNAFKLKGLRFSGALQMLIDCCAEKSSDGLVRALGIALKTIQSQIAEEEDILNLPVRYTYKVVTAALVIDRLQVAMNLVKGHASVVCCNQLEIARQIADAIE